MSATTIDPKVTAEDCALAELPAEARAVKVRPLGERGRQQPSETFGDYAWRSLTPEYRAWIKTSNAGWLAGQYDRLLDRDDEVSDLVGTAILAWVDAAGLRADFDRLRG